MDLLKTQASMGKKSGAGLVLFTGDSGSLNNYHAYRYDPGVSLTLDMSIIGTPNGVYAPSAVGISHDDMYVFGMERPIPYSGDSKNFIQKWDGTLWAEMERAFELAGGNPDDDVNDVVLTDDGSHMVFQQYRAIEYDNRISTYNRVGEVWTEELNALRNAPNGINNTYSMCRCGPNHIALPVKFLETGYAVVVYEWAGNHLNYVTHVDISEQGYGITCTDDGSRIAVGLNTSNAFKVFSFNGVDTVTELTAPVGIIGRGYGVNMTPDGDQLFHTEYDEDISVYNWDGTKYVWHEYLYQGTDGKQTGHLVFAPDGQSLIRRGNVSPYLFIHSRSGNDWAFVDGPDVIPARDMSYLALTRGVL